MYINIYVYYPFLLEKGNFKQILCLKVFSVFLLFISIVNLTDKVCHSFFNKAGFFSSFTSIPAVLYNLYILF